jgi:DNA-binding CsgD family transcriptional regulator
VRVLPDLDATNHQIGKERFPMMWMAQQVPNESLSQAGPAAGERALLRAVLEDAIRCMAAAVGPVRERAVLAAEARAWVNDTDRRWPMSFENVCDALGFEGAMLRSRLLRDHPIVAVIDVTDARVAPRPRREEPAEADVVRMIREGHPLRVVAERFGISISKASILSAGLASRLKAERDQEIRELRGAGWTHRALAAHFGLSRIRVMRICARHIAAEDAARRTAA